MTVIEKKKAQILALEKATEDCGKSEKAIRKEYAKRVKSALCFIGSGVTGGDE